MLPVGAMNSGWLKRDWKKEARRVCQISRSKTNTHENVIVRFTTLFDNLSLVDSVVNCSIAIRKRER
jgi:hypothetical protein